MMCFKYICPFEQILLTGHLILNIDSDFYSNYLYRPRIKHGLLTFLKETAAGKKRFDNDQL